MIDVKAGQMWKDSKRRESIERQEETRARVLVLK